MFPPRPRWDRLRAPPTQRTPTLLHNLGVELREARIAAGLSAHQAEKAFGFRLWLDLEAGLASAEEIRAARAALEAA